MRVLDSQLKTFVLDSGLVSRKDVESAEERAKEKNQPLSDILVSSGILGEDDVRRLQAHILGIPFVSLADMFIDFEVLSLIPEPIARVHNIVAYRRGPGTLEVAMLDTNDFEALNFVKKKSGLKILPRLTDSQSVKKALREYQKTLKDAFGDIIKSASFSASVSEEGARGDDAHIARAVDAVLRHAITQNASDIHIEPQSASLIIRYRIGGALHDAMELPKNIARGVAARVKTLARLSPESPLPQEGRFKMEADNERISVRVSTMPTSHGEKITLRLLREGTGGYTLESLGFHGKALEDLHEALREPSGLILLAGPEGSGKTTTLYTLLDILNAQNVSISTIEDRIEYRLPRVNQTEVKTELGFTLAEGLRALLKQDPDIVMVGELRDAETAHLAMNAALSGRLVLSSIPAPSSAEAIARLLKMGIEPFLLVSTLRVVVSERLVPKLCADREEYRLSKEEETKLLKHIDEKRVLSALKDEGITSGGALSAVPFYKPKAKGLSEDGFNGRAALCEVMPMTHALRELILKNAAPEDIETETRKEGALTLLEDAVFKAASGVTPLNEALGAVS